MIGEQLLPRAALELSVLMCAPVPAEVWLPCSPGQGHLGVDGAGFHLELCLGERFLFHCWCCVLSGDGPVPAVNASTKHPWRKTGFQSAFIEVGKK